MLRNVLKSLDKNVSAEDKNLHQNQYVMKKMKTASQAGYRVVLNLPDQKNAVFGAALAPVAAIIRIADCENDGSTCLLRVCYS